MERVYKFKVNTFNSKFKEVWKYCRSFDDAYKQRQFGIDNGLVSSIFEFKDGTWHHIYMKTLKINFPKGNVGYELLYFMGADWREEVSPMRLNLIEKVEAGNPIELNLEETKALYWEVENAADIKADHLDHEDWNQLQQYHLNKFGQKLYKFISSFMPLSELQ